MNQTRRSIGGLALLTLLLFVVQTESRPSTENEADIASLPPEADNVELHHVKLVDGILTEDHPIIMYKEDFVNEDYDPAKNQTKGSHHRKYKHLQRTRHHHSRPNVEKQQEKILFDVLPETPIFVGDADDDSAAYNFEAASLLEPLKKEETQPKYPKKYHSRQRRQVYFHPAHQYVQYKSTYHVPQQQLSYRQHSAPGPYYLPVEPPRQYERYPAPGKKPVYRGKLPIWQRTKPETQPTFIGTRIGEEEDDDSLFHNSNPADADFSVFNRPRPNGDGSSSSSGSNGFPSPQDGNNIFNGFQSPPEEGIGIQTTRAPTFANRPTATTQRPRQEVVTSGPGGAGGGVTTPKVSNCVWAIVNCCSQGSSRIRYSCFEEFGCHGAFWDINPCAENVRDDAIATLTRSFSNGNIAPAPIFSAPARPRPRPTYRQDALFYPEEPSYQVGSACHRASDLCCRLNNLASLYDCFTHHKCEQSLSEILSACS
ncbi:hypothetical protein ACLKA7_011184 [Drosophila subpalustris]